MFVLLLFFSFAAVFFLSRVCLLRSLHFAFNAFRLIEAHRSTTVLRFVRFKMYLPQQEDANAFQPKSNNRSKEGKKRQPSTHISIERPNCRRILICVFSQKFCYFAYLAIIVASVIYFLPFAQIIEVQLNCFFFRRSPMLTDFFPSFALDANCKKTRKQTKSASFLSDLLQIL